MLLIEVYPLNCIIYPQDEKDLELIRPWAMNYIRWNEYWSKWQKRKIKTAIANYVFFKDDRTQINILKTMLSDLISYFNLRGYKEGIHYTVQQKKLNIDIDYDHAMNTKAEWQPRGEQVYLIDFVSKKESGAILMGLLMGVGKAQPLHSLIRVPNGWKKMGEIKVGDLVYAYNGDITEVKKIHPMGLQPIYKIHCSGLRETECSLEHLFKISRIDKTEVDLTATVNEIMLLLAEGKRVFIPNHYPIREGKAFRPNEDFSDFYLIKKFFIDEEANTNTARLDDLIDSSLEDRVEFIDVLIKTLKTEEKDTFQDKRVIDYLKQLCYSSGYDITVKDHRFLFGIAKEEVEILSIERVESAYAQCIEIDHPSGLYITDDYIVTHNTSSSLFLAEKFNQRLVCVLRPKLGGNDPSAGWFKELMKATTLEEKEICLVKGSKALKSLINGALAKDLHYRAILISNKTFQFYLKDYESYNEEQFKDLGWNCTPKDLPSLLGVDTIFLDEVHLDSHLQCKMISYLGCKRIIGASATIKSSNRFIDRISKLSFPLENRYIQKEVTAYIQPTAFHYNFEKPHYIKTDGFRGYSHIKFEQSVMRHVGTKKAYFRMIREIVDSRFISRFHLYPDSKCLIVVSTIDMARELSQYLAGLYTDLVVNSYVEKDPEENIFKSHITVSTIGSSGVGLDLPNLNTVILTCGIDSKQTNLQVAGRLRYLGENILHDFIYFVCDDIPSHVRYDLNKKAEVFPGSTCLNAVNWYSGIVLNNRYGNGH